MHAITNIVASVTALLVGSAAVAAPPPAEEPTRLSKATTVLSEMRDASDKGIPENIWSKAECVVVIPSLKKAGFIIGGESGNGVMSCRQKGQWSAPVYMELTKASIGFQAGVQSTDVVLVVMNRGGAEKLLNNKVTLGGDVSIAAGPVGRTASAATDAQLTAQMLSYSHSKGLFAGINLSGGSLRPDESANTKAYGPKITAREIAFGKTPGALSAEARAFTGALSRDVRATTGKK